MTDSKSLLAYCMNVHPAVNLDSVVKNLVEYASAIRLNLVADQVLDASQSLGVGLWLSESVVDELDSEPKYQLLEQTLQELQLHPFTFNGFPQHNFHQAVVKHKVYQPTWAEPSRLEYTKRLARLMSRLHPEGSCGTISTLPIGWPDAAQRKETLENAAKQLHELATYLEELYQSSGRQVLIAIEPEPGCILGDSSSTRSFFLRYLFEGPHAELHRRYLTVCHDICHAAVMREDQKLQIQAYRECGIRIGKVQVSSAIHVDWDQLGPDERVEAFDQVRSFAEDRYLHQTTMRTGPVGSVRFIEDLSKLVAEIKEPIRLVGNWTIHFHVPIHVQDFGRLKTTQQDIAQVVEGLQTLPETPMSNGMAALPVPYRKLCTAESLVDHFTGHYEIETYAWSVLPPAFRRKSLVDDIADEFRYLCNILNQPVTSSR